MLNIKKIRPINTVSIFIPYSSFTVFREPTFENGMIKNTLWHSTDLTQLIDLNFIKIGKAVSGLIPEKYGDRDILLCIWRLLLLLYKKNYANLWV